MAPSRYDWKIVDWDVKPQHNQPTNQLHINIGIIIYWSEAGQKLVLSRSNYFAGRTTQILRIVFRSIAIKLLCSRRTTHPKIYDKRDDFDFDIVNFLFLDCDEPLMECIYLNLFVFSR